MEKVKILALAGSLRKDSLNKKLLAVAAQGARDAGADVTIVDMKEYPLPIYDGDDEAASGLPENAKKLKKLFLAHNGLLIASPEYNSSFPGGLKNLIDWVSRAETKDEPALACFTGKTAVICSASPGALGGLRGLVTLRMLLGNLGMLVLPRQVAVPRADEGFAADGKLKDAKLDASVRRLGAELAEVLKKLG